MLFAVPALVALLAMSAAASPGRPRRQVPGGWHDVPNQREPEFQEILAWTTSAVTEQAGGPSKSSKLVKVISAHQQVVAGMNYRLELEMGDESDSSVPRSICEVVVYDRPWEKVRQITSFNCAQKKP